MRQPWEYSKYPIQISDCAIPIANVKWFNDVKKRQPNAAILIERPEARDCEIIEVEFI